MKEKIKQELGKIYEEMERAEQDGNSHLAELEGWREALEWVLKNLEEGEGK